MTLNNNSVSLLWHFKLCASFRSHWWNQTGATARKRPIWVKSDVFFGRVTLKFDRWPSETIGHLSNTKVYASLHRYMWIDTTVRKRLHWVLNSVTLTFDLSSPLFMIIRWEEYYEKGITGRQMDRQTNERTDRSIPRAAGSQLKYQVSKSREQILNGYIHKGWNVMKLLRLTYCKYYCSM